MSRHGWNGILDQRVLALPRSMPDSVRLRRLFHVSVYEDSIMSDFEIIAAAVRLRLYAMMTEGLAASNEAVRWCCRHCSGHRRQCMSPRNDSSPALIILAARAVRRGVGCRKSFAALGRRGIEEVADASSKISVIAITASPWQVQWPGKRLVCVRSDAIEDNSPTRE